MTQQLKPCPNRYCKFLAEPVTLSGRHFVDCGSEYCYHRVEGATPEEAAEKWNAIEREEDRMRAFAVKVLRKFCNYLGPESSAINFSKEVQANVAWRMIHELTTEDLKELVDEVMNEKR